MKRSKPHPMTVLAAIPAILSVSLASTAPAQPDSQEQLIEASLISTAIPSPVDDFIIAVDLTVDEGWYTYWPGINDTGYGVSITFDPIKGVTFGEPYFPTPTRHLAPGNILDHVYEHTFRVLVPVSLSGELASGTELTIHANIDALVCETVCIPQTADASIDLLVTDYAVHSNEDIVEAYNNRAQPPTNAKVTWLFSGDPNDPEPGVLLAINDATHYQFFPDANCTNLANLIDQGDTQSKSLRLDFDRRYEDDLTIPATLSGRLRVKVLDAWQEYHIDYTQQTQTEKSP